MVWEFLSASRCQDEDEPWDEGDNRSTVATMREWRMRGG